MQQRRGDQLAPSAGTARLAALRLLGRRDYTASEVSAHLLERGFGPDEVSEAVAALMRDKSIDDRRTAAAHVRTASRIKGRGRLRIRRELEARGVPGAIIAQAVGEIESDEEAKTIDRVLARRRPAEGLSPAERQKLFAQLLRRGFSADLIAKRIKGVDEGE
jgi:regulatory protein